MLTPMCFLAAAQHTFGMAALFGDDWNAVVDLAFAFGAIAIIASIAGHSAFSAAVWVRCVASRRAWFAASIGGV